MNNEDIKTIEQLIDKCKNCTLQECINCEINYNQVQAIENLLNENKQLEKTITRKMNNNKKLACKYLRERHKNKQLELNEKEKEVVEAYRNLKKITGSDSWIVCNPETMWSEYFVPVAKIEEKIEDAVKKRDFYLKTDRKHILIPLYNERINILNELLEVK